MTRGLIFVLSLATINAHAETPDFQSQIDELRRVVHVQSESISELSGRVRVVEKDTETTMEVEKEALRNANKVTHVLQQEIDALSSRLSKVEK